MVSVANFFGRTQLVDRGSTWGATHREQFADWSQLANGVIWRPNTGSPAGWQQGLPDASIAQTAENRKFAAQRGCVGIHIDSVWEHWATQGPQYYVMAQLIWNPTQNTRLILDDYSRRAFGPASADIRSYFQVIEQARMNFVKEHGYGGDIHDFPRLYTEDLLSQADRHLSNAESVVDGASEIYRKRVALVRAGLTYSQLPVDTINRMSSFWQKKDVGVATQVTANWNKIERLCQEHPYAINWGPVRRSTPRMIGLHPDYPNPKRNPMKATGLDRN